ncbi:MAG: hypothetical protein AVDCRST_MAG87-1017, partial [uncultured Thermomicrobiales bacterium]
ERRHTHQEQWSPDDATMAVANLGVGACRGEHRRRAARRCALRANH